jgi:hypothetical protein
MAEAVRSEKHNRSIVYRLPTPAPWAEVSKTLSMIAQELAHRRVYDDEVMVTCGDDELLFTFDAALLEGR